MSFLNWISIRAKAKRMPNKLLRLEHNENRLNGQNAMQIFTICMIWRNVYLLQSILFPEKEGMRKRRGRVVD